MQSVELQIVSSKERIIELEDLISNVEIKVESARALSEDKRDKLNRQLHSMPSFESIGKDGLNKLRNLRAKLWALHLSPGDNCPTCLREIPHDFGVPTPDRLLSEIHATGNSLNLVQLSQATLDSPLSVYIDDAIRELEDRLLDEPKRRISIEMELMQLENQLLYLDASITNETRVESDELVRHQTLVSTLSSSLTALQSKVLSTEETLSKLQAQSAAEMKLFDITRFWEISFDKKSTKVAGFSTFRAFLFDDSILELNDIINGMDLSLLASTRSRFSRFRLHVDALS